MADPYSAPAEAIKPGSGWPDPLHRHCRLHLRGPRRRAAQGDRWREDQTAGEVQMEPGVVEVEGIGQEC